MPNLNKQTESVEVSEVFLRVSNSKLIIVKLGFFKSLTTFLCFHVQAHVKRLTLLLDNLTSDVYNLTVQVADLEKVCFE